ncbi:MAG: MTH1187 family thiamine-binding protein [Nitrospiraceae bacterium]|nr:MTH1187 family thiamine-binding protein [Nitrospiraceae bacterium]
MMVELSVVPLGKGTSVSPVIARVMSIIVESGVPYKANPMGTVLEGEWDRVMEVIRRCHEEALRDGERVVTTIKIDDYKGKGNRLNSKVESVEQKLGRKLNR